MSTTSLQKRTSVGAVQFLVRRGKFAAQLYLPKLANGRLRFDSAGELIADDAPENFIVKATTYTAKPGDRIVADTTDAPFTITLPASPSAGDRVRILDGAGTFDTNNLTLGRNSSKINGAASDLVLSTENALVDLIYVNDTIGWKAVYTASTADTLAVTGNLSAGGTFGVTGDLAVNTNKFNVTAASGNTAIAGTLGVTGNVAVNTNKFTVTAASGNTAIAGTLGVAGDVAVNTNKFNVTASSGNTAIAGTLGVTGASTLTGGAEVTGNLTVATNKFVVTAASGNTAIAGTLGVTGDVAVNTNKFTVAAASGNTLVAGTLNVTGVTTLAAKLTQKVIATPVAAAGAGGGVAGAAQLGAANVVAISSDGATKGVKLQTGAPGDIIKVINTSGTAANLFAAAGGTINGGGADVGCAIPASKGVLAICTAADTWTVYDLPAKAGATA